MAYLPTASFSFPYHYLRFGQFPTIPIPWSAQLFPSHPDVGAKFVPSRISLRIREDIYSQFTAGVLVFRSYDHECSYWSMLRFGCNSITFNTTRLDTADLLYICLHFLCFPSAFS